MGLVGRELFDRQFGKNQSFNSAGNGFCALLIAGASRLFGDQAIIMMAALLTIPTVFSMQRIQANDIDYDLARGGLSTKHSVLGRRGGVKLRAAWDGHA